MPTSLSQKENEGPEALLASLAELQILADLVQNKIELSKLSLSNYLFKLSAKIILGISLFTIFLSSLAFSIFALIESLTIYWSKYTGEPLWIIRLLTSVSLIIILLSLLILGFYLIQKKLTKI